MPVQTAIKIRRSSVASKIPLTTDLVLGELALNTTDGVLYFKKSPSGVDSIVAVATLDGTQTLTNKTLTSPVVSGGTINNAVIGGTTPAAITGSSVTSTGNLLSTYSSGDEGGEIFLAKPQTNTSIVTGVRIDIYQNKLRFWEDGGTNRGAYIDLTSATAGVGSNLLTGGGGGGTTTNALTIGTGLSGTSFNGSTAVTIAIDSTVVTLTGSQTLTNKTLTLPVIDNIRTGYTSTATAAGTTTLTVASNHYQRFTGSTTQTIVLPVTSTLAAGVAYEIENASTGNLTVNSSGGNLVITITPGVTVQCRCIGTTLTTAADWDAEYNEFATITGTGSAVLSTSPSISSITVTGTMSLTGSSSSTSSFHTNQTSGTLTLGGTSGTGTITIGRSTVTQQTDIQAGATASGSTKTINLGTGGLTGSTTTIAIGSTFGSTVTANGTWTYSGANAYGTPASITLTNATGLPVSGITASTSTALGVGSIELGHATDTTITRSSAGVVTIEGVEVVTLSRSQTLTNKTISLGSNTITGTLAQLNTAITDADVAAATHKYHEFTLNTYYYDSYSQERYFRLFTQNATYDTARYSPVTNVEYWNGTDWVTWTGGDAIVKNLLDGRDNTYADIDHTHKKFRFTINKNSGWPTNAIIATYMSWYGNAWTPYTLTIEDTADQVTWTTKETLTFGNTTNTNADYGWHAFYSGNLHNGRTLNRITYDITDWTDSGAYVTKPIYAFSIFSNYNGASDSIGVPVSWNYDKVVNFSAIPTVSSVQVATISASQTLTNKTLSTGVVYNGGVIAGQYGGTGVANTGKTITIGGNLTTSGAHTTTLTTTANTTLTLPVTGTLATLDGSETLTNKTLSSAVITGTVTAGGAVGTAGQVLASTGTGVQWVAPSAGGGLSVDESIIYSMIF